MKWARRRIEIAALATLLILSAVVLTSHFGRLDYSPPDWRVGPITHPHSRGGAIDDASSATDIIPYVRPSPFIYHTPTPTHARFSNSSSAQATPAPGAPQDKTVVFVKLEDEDASVFSEAFGDWKFVTVNMTSPFSSLHYGGAHIDKGRIADAYLTYLIENYHALPPAIAFLNTHLEERFKGNNVVEFNKIAAVNLLNMDTIASTGFANLRCSSLAGCLDNHLPLRNPPNEFFTLEVAVSSIWKELFKTDDVPEKLATPCCAEFVVSRDQVRKRSLEEYQRFWAWLNSTPMDDDTAGLVFEYLWHVIFGRDPVYCSELRECECDVYGKC